MPAALTQAELFDAEFLESLKRLHLLARRVARGGRHAEQRSRDLGSGVEFRDFRAYTPGDDFRAIDWTIYRRLGRVFLRLFEELEDLPVYLAVDVSRSLFMEQPPRARAGLRCALALASIALGQHDSVAVLPFSDDLSVALRPGAGRGRTMRVAEVLANLEPGPQTDFERSLARLATLNLREGLLVVISDFFDPGGVEKICAALQRVRHRLLLVQLVRPSDRNPDVEGDFQLVDCETGDAQDVSATAHVLELYREAYLRFEGQLTNFARRRGAGLLRLDVESEVVPQLASLFETGSYLV